MEESQFPINTKIPVQADQKAFYTDLSNQLIKISRRYQSVSGLDMIAIIGRITGVLIAQMAPDARPVAMMTLTENIDHAIALIHPAKKEQDNAVDDTAKNPG